MEELNAHAFNTELGDTITVTAAGDDGTVHLLLADKATGRFASAELESEEIDRLIGALNEAREFSLNN